MLGLDIGGANLKIADGQGYARSMPFALWSEPRRLPAHLQEFLAAAPRSNELAVTMTGELCDCFGTKEEGVRHIVKSVAAIAGDRRVLIYLTDGRLVSVDEALQLPLAAAASNWHALAAFACRFLPLGTGLLIDIGSTTTDIVGLAPAGPTPTANDDTSRLLAGELVYMGVRRTPVCSIVRSLPYRGQECPVAAEFFAAAADAYVVLGDLLEDRNDFNTADGRPLSKQFATVRLARSICADRTRFRALDARAASIAVRDAQIDRIVSAARRVIARLPKRPSMVVLSGAGEFLGKSVLLKIVPTVPTISLAEELGPTVSGCAPAHALAVLARARSLP